MVGHRTGLSVLALVCSFVAVAACGASPGSPGPAAPRATVGGVGGIALPAPGAAGQSVPPDVVMTLDKTVWWAPDLNDHHLFKIHFTRATYATAVSIPTVTFDFDAENTQAKPGSLSFGSESVLSAGGKAFSQPGSNQLKVDADGHATGRLVFQVPLGLALDTAVLTLGDPSSSQSVVPLAASTPVTTFVPKTGFLTGRLTGPDFDFDVKASRLTADTTGGHKGNGLLVVDLIATYKGPDSGGGGLVAPTDFSLTTPAGDAVAGSSIPGEPTDPLIFNPTVGQSSPVEHVGFLIPATASGDYTLTYTAEQGAAQGQQAAVKFTVG
jgi:hypothetical protein